MTPQHKSKLAQNIGEILGRRRDEFGISNRQIALEANVSHMTVNRAIDADTSVSVDTLAAICRALRLEPWRVLREAEDALQDDPAAHYIATAEAKLARLLQSNYVAAAKHHTPDPYANLGEENQESDK
ncbi:helix-turn-helix domain-containing protein [Trueperella pyogenes]|uniref:helix-turn-helix domain-containing protein n=1 Tax=Trueperella pyogenes TaxID=1661 RepID=UPI00345D956F